MRPHPRKLDLRKPARWLLRKKTLLLHPDFTRAILRRYCSTGRGIEIGPGANPQTDPRRTLYIDRLQTYRGKPIHLDIVADATSLPLPNAAFDYLFSSHVLEHCPDTLAVLKEWLRILRPGGRIVLRLPHRDRTFDQKRPLTTLQHHIQDHAAHVSYDDQTHWEEFVTLAIDGFPHTWKQEAQKPDGTYDLPWMISHSHFHYHVWTQTEMVDLLRYMGCHILFTIDQTLDRTDSFLVVGEVKTG